VEAALKAARIEGATVLGFVSAIGACGGYLIPRAFGASIKATGSVTVALAAFVVFYATCITLTWVSYMQRKTLPSSVGVRAMEAQV
jgi:NNP family nitrate/nitrite transporter-like MFS transporter